VQPGPTRAQPLAWFGADGVKVERLGVEHAPEIRNQITGE
jgi:crotonobetainyl-CoA:carnitine CoA-transferase CaiB-like acyl-CoA transferase